MGRYGELWGMWAHYGPLWGTILARRDSNLAGPVREGRPAGGRGRPADQPSQRRVLIIITAAGQLTSRVREF